jgi:hypothetical protein
MRLVYPILAIFAARFFVSAIAFPSIDGDLAWQGWLGRQVLALHAIPNTIGPETFSAPGAEWTPQEWLFGIGVALTRGTAWWPLFAGLAAACAVLTLWLVAGRAARRGASSRAVAICVLFAGIGAYESFGVRVQVVAWPLVALALLALDGDVRRRFWLVPIAALWSNVHASAMLAPAFAALAFAGDLLEDRAPSARVRTGALVVAATALAVCCNPLGWHLPAYAVMLFTSAFKQYITEWKVTDIDDTSFAYGALPLLVGALVFGIRARAAIDGVRDAATTTVRDLVVFAAVAYLMFGAARNVPVFCFAVAPLVALALTREVAWFRVETEAPTRRMIGFQFALTTVVFAVVAGSLLSNGEARSTEKLALDAVDSVERAPGEHRVLCQDFAWCSLLVGSPHDRVFIDGRADPYPIGVWRDYVAIVRVTTPWSSLLDAHGVDTVIASRDAALDRALAESSAWHATFTDAKHRVWMRDATR